MSRYVRRSTRAEGLTALLREDRRVGAIHPSAPRGGIYSDMATVEGGSAMAPHNGLWTSLLICLSLTVTFGPAIAQTNTIALQALANPRQEVMLAAETDGQLAEIAVVEGEAVDAGAVVAQLDDRVQAARVAMSAIRANSTAQVRKAELVLQAARERHVRLLEAKRRGAIPAWELTEAEQQMAVAEADLMAARDAKAGELARLETEKHLLAVYTVRSPFKAHVSEIYTDIGTSLRRGDKIARLVDLSELETTVFLPVDLLPRIDTQTPITVQLPDPYGGEADGRLVFIDHIVEPASRSVRATVLIDNADLRLPAGLIVTVVLQPEAEG